MKTPETKTFLLVEDEQSDADLVAMEFAKVPHLRLRHVRDGQEAMHYLEGRQPYNDRVKYPRPDVILLDLKMPGVDGFEFLRWIHDGSPDDLRLIPIMVMSSSDLEEDLRQAYKLGANAYFTKPTNWKKFQQRMKLLGIFWGGEHAETPKTHAV